MTTPTKIAKAHYEAAMKDAAESGQGEDAIARAMLNLVVETYMKTRSMEDVAQELQGAAENLDPDTDYMFMRP